MIQKIVAPEIKEVLNLNRRMFKLVFQYNKFLLPLELQKKKSKKIYDNDFARVCEIRPGYWQLHLRIFGKTSQNQMFYSICSWSL